MRKAVLLAVVWMAACSDYPADPFDGRPAVGLLPGAEWTLVAAVDQDGDPIRVDVRFTARFEDAYVGGHAGPNAYGGDFEAEEDGTLHVSSLVSTLIGGPEADKGFELLKLLSRANAFQVGSNELRIFGSGAIVLRFERS